MLGPAEEDLELSVRLLSDFQLHVLYLRARDEVDRLNGLLSALNLEVEAYTRLLCDRWLEAGETTKTFEGGVSIGVSPEPYPVISDQPKFVAWIRETGQEALLTVNYQTAASIVKSRLEAGESLPPGVDVFVKDKLSCRGRNKNKGDNNDGNTGDQRQDGAQQQRQ